MALACRDLKLPSRTVAHLRGAASVSASASGDEAEWGDGAGLGESCERDMTLVALCGIEDPLRPCVPAAIAAARCGGIKVKMLTGDGLATAEAVARKAGILPSLVAPRAAAPGGPPGADPGTPPSDVVQRQVQFLQQPVHPLAVMEGEEFRRRVLDGDGCIRKKEFLEVTWGPGVSPFGKAERDLGGAGARTSCSACRRLKRALANLPSLTLPLLQLAPVAVAAPAGAGTVHAERQADHGPWRQGLHPRHRRGDRRRHQRRPGAARRARRLCHEPR